MNLARQRKFERLLAYVILLASSFALLLLYLSSFKPVKAPYLALRSTPNTTSQVQAVVTNNDRYALITTKDGWSYIYANEQIGWTPTNTLSQTALSASEGVVAVVAQDDTVSVFSDPRNTEKELGKLDKNTTYYVYFERNGWSQIIFNNQVAWVMNDKLTKK